MYFYVVAVWLVAMATAAMADPFDPPSAGTWICPDGHVSSIAASPCRPPEIAGKWWESCIPGRTDCVQSDTAVVGWDTYTRAKRGPGYCYTQQPYTCSPNGKAP